MAHCCDVDPTLGLRCSADLKLSRVSSFELTRGNTFRCAFDVVVSRAWSFIIGTRYPLLFREPKSGQIIHDFGGPGQNFIIIWIVV